MTQKQKDDASQKKRIEFIDLAKGICIMLVVIVHVVPELDPPLEFLACLRMPLYFCLSGLFFKDYGGLRNLTIKKVNKILIPFVAWYLIGYLIYYACRAAIHSTTESTFSMNDLFISNDIFNLPIWFLLCLFWSNILFFIVRKISQRWYVQLQLVFGLGSIGLFLSERKVFNFLYFGSSLTCMPFFYMGYALKQTMLLYPSTKKKRDFAIMMFCLLVAFLIIMIPDNPPRLVYHTNMVKYGHPVQIYAGSALFVIGVLIMCKFMRHIPFVSWLGRYSIIVLVTHMWLKEITGRVLLRFWGDSSIVMLECVNLMIVLMLMALMIPFCKRYLPYITAQKDVVKIRTSGNRHDKSAGES